MKDIKAPFIPEPDEEDEGVIDPEDTYVEGADDEAGD